ncbi:unnamed protein product [Durusdinium trenchii]|uniref:VWFA domain-containing protein n=1 Tax=Durusdinium trenchii TaxID=1381693 RepID=A0ABP0NRZ0_9DINO
MQMPAVLKDQESAVLSILDIVSHSCRTVLQSLSPDDRLAIVTYSDQAQVVLPLTCMDAQGQGEAEAAVQKLRADGQTNLWQGQGWGSHQPQNPGRALCSLSKLLPGL